MQIYVCVFVKDKVVISVFVNYSWFEGKEIILKIGRGDGVISDFVKLKFSCHGSNCLLKLMFDILKLQHCESLFNPVPLYFLIIINYPWLSEI